MTRNVLENFGYSKSAQDVISVANWFTDVYVNNRRMSLFCLLRFTIRSITTVMHLLPALVTKSAFFPTYVFLVKDERTFRLMLTSHLLQHILPLEEMHCNNLYNIVYGVNYASQHVVRIHMPNVTLRESHKKAC